MESSIIRVEPKRVPGEVLIEADSEDSAEGGRSFRRETDHGSGRNLRPTRTIAMVDELLGGGKKDAGSDGSGMSNARLAILPGLTHYNICASPALASTVTSFL
jgi:hypothetical protein